MDDTTKDQIISKQEKEEADDTPVAAAAEAVDNEDKKIKSTKKKCKKPEHKTRKRVSKSSAKKSKKEQSGSASSTSDDSDDDDTSSDSSDASLKKRRRNTKAKDKKTRRKAKKAVEDSDTDSSEEVDADSSDDSSSSEDEIRARKVKKAKAAKKAMGKKLRKAKKLADAVEEDDDSDDESVAASSDELSVKSLQAQIAELKRQVTLKQMKAKPQKASSKSLKLKTKATKSETTAVFKRVDQIWDSTIHNYKLKESVEDDDAEFAEYAFLVRRTFDWENRYQCTRIDIKSKHLRAALAEVMKGCKSVSLEATYPCIDPNTLFLYLEELRTYYKKTLKTKIKAEKKKKAIKKLEQQRSLLKTLVAYIDDDYEDTKKTLYPLLKAGNITFELLWALFKPNEVAVTSCYGTWDEPRCFKVDYAHKCTSMMRGEWYCMEGKYLEYDGKAFGFGDFEVDVDAFKGPRKITSLATYPLKYHKDPESVKKQILSRAEKFIEMDGMQYKFHKGLAFMKKKKQVLKINIDGRVMIDPSNFRRVNPNYPISFIKPKDEDDLFSISDDEDSEDACSCDDSGDEEAADNDQQLVSKSNEDRTSKYKYKWAQNTRGETVFLAVEVDENGDPLTSQRMDKLEVGADQSRRTYTEDELLLTTPVMLGFAFSEKLWLEFTISRVHDITYNEDAFDSLVLPSNHKSIVRAQVESHKFYAAKTIDDVVQGKGKGLVAVLHGPPGTGKTLTAEGIAELLKCPLYMVSAGELGTDPARLEHELQKILDIAHSWGAVLLLDEADVFLEKREVHDIHRNALVSIFLRLLEYFQGILFLTTNRVETFDDAFQSRIHIALRYNELNHKARKAVWKMFLDRVKAMEDASVSAPSDEDLEVLARTPLNGRQIKNMVRTAQALALSQKQTLAMSHIKQVIDFGESFERDLKGGTGYVDAMRSYT